MSRDKYFKGYNPDFLSAYGKRDWQKDMELCQKLNQWYEHEWQAGQEELSTIISIYEILPDEPCNFVADCENDLTAEFIIESRQALPCWLKEAKELQAKLSTAKEELVKINCDYYADKQRFVVQRRELEESKAREQKLREGIEEALRDATKWENPYEVCNDIQKLLDSLYPKEETK
ncbi:MAG: hypothetical protein AB2401_07615 [Bacillus sp. (in: firmicutes)]